MSEEMNSEERAVAQEGRRVVNVALGLYVKAQSQDDAQALADQWLQALQNGDEAEAKRLRLDSVYPSNWDMPPTRGQRFPR